MNRLIRLIATNGGLGNIPYAPGTWGTLAGIPAFYLMADLPAWLYGLTWLGIFALGTWAATEAGRQYGVVDDGRIVIDELAGYLVTVAGLPFTWGHALLGFVLFRLFDIVKLPPASTVDRRIKNGFGVMLDDVLAGVYGLLALRFLLYL